MSTQGLVTIPFTDLVGSTALSQDVGDAAADTMRREHFNVLRQAIGRTGGTEVKSIGDALMVSYPAAADAIAGAVAMQRGVDLHNHRSAGDASFEDGDWFGTPVVEASRFARQGARTAGARDRPGARPRPHRRAEPARPRDLITPTPR